ncbi:MAG: CPBP family intramembrane metalloprotease [Clostridia bacterium]|nr:CPBP family intramembrane metalloprotease [Clostridia bacterium]
MNKLKFTLQPETGRLSESDAKRYFSTFGVAACIFMVAYHLSNYLLSYAIYLFAPWLLENAIVGHLFSIVTLYGIAFPFFFLFLRQLPSDQMAPMTMGTKDWWRALCVSLAFMMIGNYIGNFFISYFTAVTGNPLQNPVESATSGQSFWINLVFVAISGPILEELVFRKAVCDRLLPLGEGYAVILSAVLFGLVHGNFFQFFYAAAVGALFALIYVKTGRIRYSISYHIIINFLGGVIAPWLIDRISPWISEEGMEELVGMAESDPAGLFRIWQVYLLPLVIYEGIFLVAAVLGVVFLVKGRKKIHFLDGLLPPPKENRVSNVFCNAGVAAALAVFAGIFLLSLL